MNNKEIIVHVCLFAFFIECVYSWVQNFDARKLVVPFHSIPSQSSSIFLGIQHVSSALQLSQLNSIEGFPPPIQQLSRKGELNEETFRRFKQFLFKLQSQNIDLLNLTLYDTVEEQDQVERLELLYQMWQKAEKSVDSSRGTEFGQDSNNEEIIFNLLCNQITSDMRNEFGLDIFDNYAVELIETAQDILGTSDLKSLFNLPSEYSVDQTADFIGEYIKKVSLVVNIVLVLIFMGILTALFPHLLDFLL